MRITLTLVYLFPSYKQSVSSILWAFAPLLIVFMKTLTENYYSLIYWPSPKFLLLHWEYKLIRGHPVTTDLNASWLSINKTVADIPSAHLVKLLLFQKAAAVVVTVDLACTKKDFKEQREGYLHKTNLSKFPLPLLPPSSVQKGRWVGDGHIFKSLWYMREE